MPSDAIISVENLGKKYRLHHEKAGPYTTLREVVTRRAKSFLSFGKQTAQVPAAGSDEDFWALSDISLEIRPGEVVGVIGRNGAGKSTLLKILSRITEPTKGRITLRGRVASLLEVGTGFHPELTGRENIFLNGAILGMSRAEIRRNFDEIVDFAEVEKFLDTAVKHYSSGMYVRLAFAVAAHLQPEILVVDEVLAVGDAKFQKKSMARMNDAAKSGRTILFVSHSMPAVRSLCNRAILLKSGKIFQEGSPEEIIATYNNDSEVQSLEQRWEGASQPGDDKVRLLRVRVSQDQPSVTMRSSEDIHVDMEVTCTEVEEGLCVGFELFAPDGSLLFWSYHNDSREDLWPKLKLGRNLLRCTIPAGLLNAGRYSLSPLIGVHNVRWVVYTVARLAFEVELNHGVSPYWTSLSIGRRPGLLTPILKWQTGSEK